MEYIDKAIEFPFIFLRCCFHRLTNYYKYQSNVDTNRYRNDDDDDYRWTVKLRVERKKNKDTHQHCYSIHSYYLMRSFFNTQTEKQKQLHNNNNSNFDHSDDNRGLCINISRIDENMMFLNDCESWGNTVLVYDI